MRLIFQFLLVAFTTNCFGQQLGLIGKKAIHFQIKTKADTIDFVVVDTALKAKKPVFLFCQGSLPMPLFVKFKKYGTEMVGGGVSNFDLPEIKKHYHLVIVSMPKTPVVVEERNINDNYCYVPDSTQKQVFSRAYIEADYLQNYVDRADRVLRFLQKQTWVNPQKTVVAGHSQGSKVAGKLALQNKKVTHVGLFAANPFGRVDQFVRQARLDAQFGKITWEQADQQMEEQYQYFREAHQADSLKLKPELKAWKTFSEPFIDDWLKLKTPLYLAYGTEDRTADLCDLVPLFFIQENKNNLTFKRYLGLDHNFFEVENGRANYNKGHWPEVMNRFVQWTMEN